MSSDKAAGVATRAAVGPSVQADVDEDEGEDCPDCAGTVRPDGDEQVCQACGLVVRTDRLDRGPDWCSLDGEDGRRSGPPVDERRHDRVPGSRIGWQPDERSCSPSKRRRLGRLRTWNARSRFETKADHNCAQGLGEIRRMAVAIGQSEGHQNQACRLFKTAQNEGLLPGRSIEGLASASCYAVSRLNQSAVTIDDVAAVARVDMDRIKYCYRLLNRRLDLPAPPPAPERFVGRLVDGCGLGLDVRRRATRLVEEATEAGIGNGRNPVGVAAGAVYIAAGGSHGLVSQETLADVADLSSLTVRERYREIQDVVDDE